MQFWSEYTMHIMLWLKTHSHSKRVQDIQYVKICVYPFLSQPLDLKLSTTCIFSLMAMHCYKLIMFFSYGPRGHE